MMLYGFPIQYQVENLKVKMNEWEKAKTAYLAWRTRRAQREQDSCEEGEKTALVNSAS